ncbi:Haloacid dehalogenase-like hydrolase-domain-containing protein [Cyathus striatus]|nr:Haloacid dehalogenase-like hydrolase-domain-containing protein [Cyathus striatus]
MGSNFTFQTIYSTLILDLSNILLPRSPPLSAPLTPKSLRAMLSSSTWFAYEKGQIGEGECYSKLAADFNTPVHDIRATLLAARKSLRPNHKFLSFIQSLRQIYPKLRVLVMSNIVVDDFEAIRGVLDSWNIFDGIFVSCHSGERKPHLGFYRGVISAADVCPKETIFVDDNLDNVLSARSVGFRGIVFDSCDHTIRMVKSLVGDPIARGKAFLKANARVMESITETGIIVEENFSQLLIMEATNDPSLVNIRSFPSIWNFFRDGGVAADNYPFDLDTTSLAYSIIKCDDETVTHVMDEMLKYVDVDGIIQTYFDHRRPRIDPIVCTNVLTLFYLWNRGSELAKTFEWVYEVLQNRAYLDGTRYYTTAESFLYFIMRFLQVALLKQPDDPILFNFRSTLKECVAERVGISGNSLALAKRLIACKYLGVENQTDRSKLLDLQCEDGGWEIGWTYRYGVSGIGIGNRGLTTAFALEALK